MNGDVALDTSVAIRLLNGDETIAQKALSLPRVILPAVTVGELLYGAENSNRSLHNLSRCRAFVDNCVVVPIGKETAAFYAQTRAALKRKGRPIPMNDIWIAAQCIENNWILSTLDSDFSYIDGLVVEYW